MNLLERRLPITTPLVVELTAEAEGGGGPSPQPMTFANGFKMYYMIAKDYQVSRFHVRECRQGVWGRLNGTAGVSAGPATWGRVNPLLGAKGFETFWNGEREPDDGSCSSRVSCQERRPWKSRAECLMEG